MKIPLLVFSVEKCEKPQEIELKFDRESDFEILRQQPLPKVYLITNENLAKLIKFTDFTINRGVKHKAKSLSKLLLGYTKFPLIDGNFESSRQVRRSVRTLLKHAMEQHERNAYFVGVADKIFDEFLKSSAGSQESTTGLLPNEFYTSRKLDECPDISEWLVQELHNRHRCHVPEGLQKSYVGVSQEAMLVRQQIVLAANENNDVLILGDTGTGKEVVAKAIHALSSRKDSPFLAINCGGLSTALLESELFGHVKGAFTDAIHDKDGLWKLAGDGTLFLDEIGDLQLDSQVKILRVLEDRKIRPVGGETLVNVRARVVAATNRDLFTLTEKGIFREDLFYRLRSFPIRTPSLRHHPEDIPGLADFFWKNIAKDAYTALPFDIIENLQLYLWPGNVRELKRVLENLHSLFGPHRLRLDHLKAVFSLGGQEIQQPIVSTSKNSGVGKKNIEELAASLHQLKCAREVLRSLEIQLEQFRTQTEESPRLVFKFGISELETLCRQPSLFGDSFSDVWSLLEKLNWFQESIVTKINRTEKVTEPLLIGMLKRVQAILSMATKDIIKSIL